MNSPVLKEKVDTVIGIYKITCLYTNKVYVGSSCNIHIRWKQHQQDLIAKKHINRYLQYSYDNYGDFTYEILEVLTDITRQELLVREQYYIDLHRSMHRKYGYNIVPAVKAKSNGKVKGTKAKVKARITRRRKRVKSYRS
jgi:group I intron endonuclease